jgi:hypothetical protein
LRKADWNRCTDPDKMLGWLRGNGRASPRKLRLFACASCRQVWHFLTDKRCRAAVEQAERYADGLASKKSLTPFRVEARKAVLRQNIPYWRQRAFHACLNVVENEPAPDIAAWAAQNAYGAVLCNDGDHEAVRKTQADLLRDIFGPLPFRTVRIDPAWLAWNGGAVRKLAEAAYAERSMPAGTLDAGRLAVLADALEEAGCCEPEILGHCRQQESVHVRGCWVIDLILGKS